MFYLRQLSERWHPCLRKLQVTGCLVMNQNIVVLLLYCCNSISLLGLNSKSVPLVTFYTLTRKSIS